MDGLLAKFVLQALADYNKAIEINPDLGVAYDNRGGIYRHKGKLDAAIAEHNKAIEINPNGAEAYYNRALAYKDKNNFNQAITDWTKAIEINPKYAEAYNNRAFTYFLIKDYDKSWADVHKIENLGFHVDPKFLGDLKKISGREK